MLYASKFVSDVAAKQAAADATMAGFSVEVQNAIALAEHFEKIMPEEYVVPSTWHAQDDEEAFEITAETNIWAGYSRL